jgi:magnesium-protoporphyrin O-methyltransferase
MGGCCGEGIPACERVFDRQTADRDVRDFRRNGAPWATRELIEELASGLDLAGGTVLDVGAGVGAVHLTLLGRGAASAVDVDGSGAYVAVAREEAERAGLGDRVRHVLGDLTIVAPALEPADIVALDRVVCCYGDMASLLTAASTLARRRLGLVYPRDRWWIRAGAAVGNLVMFRRSAGYRMRVHRVTAMAALLEAAGFARVAGRNGRLWRVETWDRVGLFARDRVGGGAGLVTS